MSVSVKARKALVQQRDPGEVEHEVVEAAVVEEMEVSEKKTVCREMRNHFAEFELTKAYPLLPGKIHRPETVQVVEAVATMMRDWPEGKESAKLALWKEIAADKTHGKKIRDKWDYANEHAIVDEVLLTCKTQPTKE